MPAKYHAAIIGKAGAGITKLRTEYDVQFDFPKRGKDGSAGADSITVTGYEAKANKAKDMLLAKVAEMDKVAQKDIEVDQRIHSRIIGGRGAGIKALQDKFKVRVNFPRDKASNTITITGEFDDVEEAANEILNKAEEYVRACHPHTVTHSAQMEDLQAREAEQAPSTKAKAHASNGDGHAGNGHAAEFRMRGGPWDANNQTDFPSLGAAAKKAAPAGAARAAMGTWLTAAGAWGRK